VNQFSIASESDNQNSLTNAVKCCFLCAVEEMKTTFTKLMKHAVKPGMIAWACQRNSRHLDIVGMKF